jgi:hypothetical protein
MSENKYHITNYPNTGRYYPICNGMYLKLDHRSGIIEENSLDGEWFETEEKAGAFIGQHISQDIKQLIAIIEYTDKNK